MKISKVKELVLANELAIENDSTRDKLKKVLKYCFPDDKATPSGNKKYYFKFESELGEWFFSDSTELKSIKLSEIELIPSFKDQVIELRKQYPNDFDFGWAVNRLLNEYI